LAGTPSPGPPRLEKTPGRSTLSPKGERGALPRAIARRCDRSREIPDAVLKEGEKMGEMEEVEFGDPLILARFSIDELTSFYHQAKKHFASRLAGLEARSKSVSREEEESDYLADRMEEVEGLLNLVEYFGVIGAYRTFEIFLGNVVDQLRKEGFVEGSTEPHLGGLKKQLKEFGVDLTQPPFRWEEIKKLQTIRNCIAHSDGWVDSRYVSQLRDYTLPVEEEEKKKEHGSPLRLPSGYFLEASALVASTCGLVIEKCAEVRRGRREEHTL
jgi:hypothetical protein